MADRNSARQYEYGTYKTSNVKKKKEEKKQERIERTLNEDKSSTVVNVVFIAVLAAVLLGSVIFALDRRNTVYNQVSDLSGQLTLVEAENVRLQSELESRVSAKNIEDYAENVLGMQKIDSSQIKYIKIQTDDVVSIPQKDKGLLSKVKFCFDKCVEYFRG